MREVIVLLSGGFDSSTLAYSLSLKGFSVRGLFINYGQKMADTEMRAAKYIAEKKGFPLNIVNIPLDKSLVTGCLFDNETKDLKTERYLSSFLPQRNLLLLTIAAMFAQQHGIQEVFIGVIKPYNFLPFPDTTLDFMNLAEKVLRKSYPELTLRYPFINMDKTSIALLAKELGVPLEYTFSCEMKLDHHCMKCPSCLDRYWALHESE